MPFDMTLLSTALMGALAYGAGDFLGGRAALRLSTFPAIAAAQTISVAYIAHVFLLSGQGIAEAHLLLPCIVAGCAYVTGLALLYHGLAHGQIGVVAPICALFSVLVPLAGDFHLQRQVEAFMLFGVSLCTAAAVLIASSSPTKSAATSSRSIWLGIGSGLGYGFADLLIGQIPAQEAWGALLVMRLVATSLAVIVVAVLLLAGRSLLQHSSAGVQDASGLSLAIAFPGCRETDRPATGSCSYKTLGSGLLLAGMAGVLDTLGQIGYVAAATHGSMGVAAALVGLFPGVSVLLAVVILGERVGSTQLLGLATGATGVLLLSS